MAVLPAGHLSFLTVVRSRRMHHSISMRSLLLFISSYLQPSAARSDGTVSAGAGEQAWWEGRGVRGEGN
jgi:hypothetical protein